LDWIVTCMRQRLVLDVLCDLLRQPFQSLNWTTCLMPLTCSTQAALSLLMEIAYPLQPFPVCAKASTMSPSIVGSRHASARTWARRKIACLPLAAASRCLFSCFCTWGLFFSISCFCLVDVGAGCPFTFCLCCAPSRLSLHVPPRSMWGLRSPPLMSTPSSLPRASSPHIARRTGTAGRPHHLVAPHLGGWVPCFFEQLKVIERLIGPTAGYYG